MPGEKKDVAVLTFYKGDGDVGDTEEEKHHGIFPVSTFTIPNVSWSQ